MYKIHADGQLLFDSLSEEVQHIALSPKLTLDINKAGSLSMVLPPGNALHGQLKKMKSVLTVEQDGEQLFRGRVTETETDTYNQQNAYCEGDKAFLKDSVFSPGALSGKVRDFFRSLVSNHNEQVDAEKRFTVGIIDAVGADVELNPESRQETRVYWNTLDMMEDSLLNVYGGYLRTRTEGSTNYLDWVKQYGEANSQPIEFTVNLLDLTAKADAGEVFTVLIPLGASEIGEDGEYTDPVSIASVNGGKNYIQDDAAVALYGRIWKTRTWSYIEDPAKLLERGREYLKTGIALETITLKAIDMHFVDGNVQPIRIGDRVRILSNPHGIDKVLTCTQIEIDLHNPENTVYTFGERPRTLSENVVRAEKEVDGLTGRGGGGRKNVQQEISDIIRWAKINVDETNAYIQLTAGELDKTNQRLSAAEIEIDGVNAKLTLAASRVEELEGKTTSALIEIDGANAQILLHAQTLEDHGNAITAAEIAIDGLNSEIEMKADTILLSGYVKMSQFEAEIAEINSIFAGYSQAQNLHVNYAVTAQSGQFTNISLINYDCNWKTPTMGEITLQSYLGKTIEDAMNLEHSHRITVDDATGALTLGGVTAEPQNFNIADTDFHKNAVSASYNKGKTDWSPVDIERTSYSVDEKNVTVRAVNAVGAPLIALEEIDASEIYEAGAESVANEIVIGSDAPASITHLGDNVYQMKVRIWAKYNGETIASTYIYPSKGVY